MAKPKNPEWIVVPKGYRVTRIEKNRYDLESVLPLCIELRKLNDLGPGLRVESKGWLSGSYKVFRISTDPLGGPRNFEPELIHIPSGISRMGYPFKGLLEISNLPEVSSSKVSRTGFWIGRYPVTVREFAFFVEHYGYYSSNEEEFGYDAICWRQPMPGEYRDVEKYERHPVTCVSKRDAEAYCQWLSSVTGKKYSLPTQEQWELAAFGTDGRKYPWGNKEPDRKLCNIEHWFGGTTPVGMFSPDGDGPKFDNLFGCADMFGNVTEWTLNTFSSNRKIHPDCDPDNYYYQTNTYCVTCGPSWRMDRHTRRSHHNYSVDYDYFGFRVVAQLADQMDDVE
jgi:formylglycine-generating enzyme required for sulfatase activity